MTAVYNRTEEKALVVFSGETDLAYLKLLRPGFRHCFVVLHTPGRWLSIDPLSHMTRIDLMDFPGEFDMAALLRREGLCVVETTLREAPLLPAPPMLCTCVEMVKRILGIHRWTIVTPWQLYRYLLRELK